MNLVPTLWLGPRRLVRRPVETLLLVLSVALGTLATVTATDALVGIQADLDRTSRVPWVREVEVWDQDLAKWTAVMSDERYQAALGRFDHPGDYSAWVDQVVPGLPGLETAWFDFGAASRVRVGEASDWTQPGRSFCAQPGLFRLSSVALAAGRFPTREEFDRGAAGTVIGVHLAETLFPGLSPDQVLGKELQVNRNFWEPGLTVVRVVGVCRQAPGTQEDVNGDPGEWLVLGRKAEETWGTATFVARSVDQVPALVARLKALAGQDPRVRSLQVSDRYDTYAQKKALSLLAAALTLGIGTGTLLIALWTLGSVFRARLPSLRRTKGLLKALGADRTTLLGMDLSEILPVSMGGMVLGLAASVAVRVTLIGRPATLAQDPVLVAGLLVLVVGLPFLQVALPPGRSPRKGHHGRLVTTVAFLTLGLAGSDLALSLAQDLGRSLPRLQAPLPLWAGLVRSQQDRSHYIDDAHRMTAGDLSALGRILPADAWSPVVDLSGQMGSTAIRVPLLQDRRFWIRHKLLGRSTLAGFFGLPLVTGRLPTDGPENGALALVSEEVAEALFGSSQTALGKVIIDDQQGPAGKKTEQPCEVVGVFASPPGPRSDLGSPDLIVVPPARFWEGDLADTSGVLVAFDPHKVSRSLLTDQVLPLLRSSHPGAVAEVWSGGAQLTVPPDWADGLKASASANLTIVVLLAGLSLVVSCLGVLGDLFVRITSRSRAIALERALGRPFVHFAGRAFLRGASMVLGASVLAAGVASLVMPVLAPSLAPYLGDLLVRSTGVVDLAPGTIVPVTLGAALLAGSIAILPLLPYRRGPLSSQLGGAL